ncbi:hypothetical protein BC629DRAFT_1594001 [Irpex lacteus]|nr:hypothetical protein BC629DRAFT_1594001 [Irpex lacteus]
MAKIPILLLGATGTPFILVPSLSRYTSFTFTLAFDITVLVRSPEKAKKLEAFDVKSIVGSFEDTALLEQLAENAHVLFSTADSDNLDADCVLYIVIPSTVWGTAKHTLVDAGISNPRSIQVPWLIQASLDRDKQVWSVKVWRFGLTSISKSWDTDVTATISVPMVNTPGMISPSTLERPWATRLSKSDEPTTFSNEELVKYWGSEDYGNNYGSNARVRAGHSRSLGWQPKLSTQDFLDSIDDEVEAVIQRRRAQQEEESDKERKRHEYIKQITKDHVIQA